MGTTIHNEFQNLSVMKKELEKLNKPGAEKQQTQNTTSQADSGGNAADTIVYEFSSPGITATKSEAREITNAQEAQHLLSEVISEASSENGVVKLSRSHNLNPGSVIDLLA